MTLRDATGRRRHRLLMPAALVTVVLLPGSARPAVAMQTATASSIGAPLRSRAKLLGRCTRFRSSLDG